MRKLMISGALVLLLAIVVRAEEQPPAASETEPLVRVGAAVERGLEYIATKQKPDGSWYHNNAVNALALLSFMGRGHVPLRGPYRDVLERGKRYLLSTQREDGFFPGSMYMHALTTLALAEMYGMDYDPQLEASLRKAVDLIVRVQSPSGGWRYAPQPGDQDLSVTVMQVVALRAANNAEIPVPAETIQKAIGYVRSCAAAGGGYSYSAGGGANPQMSAAGILSLQLFGQYNDPTILPALKYLSKIPVAWGGGGVGYFYYFHYYAIQAEYQAGGGDWNSWHPRVRDLLLSKQNANGSWDLPGGSHEADLDLIGPDKVYWTAMSCLVLEIYNHYLPAYQR